jgi:sec-independent protein translocase protein TatA
MALLFISTGEIFMLMLVLVLLFGSKKIPEIARGFGKGIREFKNATSDIQEEIRKTSREITDQADVNKKAASKTNTQPDTAKK